MFDLGTWGEILIIFVAVLVFIGPKELPDLLRGLGRLIQKFKNMSSGMRREIDQYIHEGEFEEYTKSANSLGMMAMDEDSRDPMVNHGEGKEQNSSKEQSPRKRSQPPSKKRGKK